MLCTVGKWLLDKPRQTAFVQARAKSEPRDKEIEQENIVKRRRGFVVCFLVQLGWEVMDLNVNKADQG